MARPAPLSFVMVLLLGLGVSVPGQAQAPAQAADGEATAMPEDGGDPADAEARSQFHLGQAAYDRGQYEEAAAYFRRAHELSGRPEMLYNIGQATDRLGLKVEAIRAFDGFLQARPETPLRARIEARLAVLRRDVAVEGDLRRAAERPGAEAPSAWASPWLWTGVAALVAGVVIVALVLSSGRDEAQAGDVGGIVQVLRSSP